MSARDEFALNSPALAARHKMDCAGASTRAMLMPHKARKKCVAGDSVSNIPIGLIGLKMNDAPTNIPTRQDPR